MAGMTIQKVSITHDNIIDYVISRPRASYKEIAAQFNYTKEGIGIIVRSDAFKARLEVRKAELVDPIITQNLEERLIGLAHSSIDILMDKLETSTDEKFALAALDTATRASNYGARTNQAAGGVTFVVQLPGPATNSDEWSSKFGPKVVEEAKVVSPKPVSEEKAPSDDQLALF